jgi:acetyltransferase-like isoleucine patch superfamily enzyme
MASRQRVRIQLQLIVIWCFNVVLRLLPGHALRIAWLTLTGARLGRGTAFHPRTYLTRPGRLTVGSGCTINFGCYLDTRGGITIGDDVMIGHRVRIYTAGHRLDDDAFSGFNEGVTIEPQAVVFPCALVMPGVRVGRGAVVLTGSVVVKDVPDFTVVGGNPARPLRQRSPALRYTHDYRVWLANA